MIVGGFWGDLQFVKNTVIFMIRSTINQWSQSERHLAIYKSVEPKRTASRHLRRLARRIGVRKNQQVLDVACGTGEWLLACKELGAFTNGVDLSERAISACKTSLGEGEYFSMPAEVLPFEDARFDVVTCLGSLEHFIDPVKALKEMVRVAKTDAIFLLLVPNADFLTRRLGLFGGTYQTDAKEEVRPLF